MVGRARRGLLYIGEWWLRLPWPPPVRVWWLRLFGVRIGPHTRVHRCSFINLEAAGFAYLWLGADVHVGPEVLFDLQAPIEVQDRSTLSPRVTIITHSDPGAAELGRYPTEAPVSILQDCWIGTSATILEGVIIGPRSVVGAGALVRHSVAPGETVVGVPAGPIG